MVFLYDFKITNEWLINKLKRNILGYFEETTNGHYICKGYDYPLLARVSNGFSLIHSPFKYSGSYSYGGENEITLHSTYGRFRTYKKMIIFGIPFMVDTEMSEEDAVLAAMTDKHFIESLIRALA